MWNKKEFTQFQKELNLFYNKMHKKFIHDANIIDKNIIDDELIKQNI